MAGIVDAQATIKGRANELHVRDQAAHNALRTERDAKAAKTGKKLCGWPPVPPVVGPLPGDQANLTHAESRIMPMAGGGLERCYNAPSVVAADSLLIVAANVRAALVFPCGNLPGATLRSVFRLALRQTEGLIGSIIHLLGLTLVVPDHTTLSRRAETLEVPHPKSRKDGEPLHLLVDSTGLKLCGAGEWLIEKHGTKTRRSWRKLYFELDADTGQIVAVALTTK